MEKEKRGLSCSSTVFYQSILYPRQVNKPTVEKTQCNVNSYVHIAFQSLKQHDNPWKEKQQKFTGHDSEASEANFAPAAWNVSQGVNSNVHVNTHRNNDVATSQNKHVRKEGWRGSGPPWRRPRLHAARPRCL
jgi:hypothetical protein